MEKIGQISLQVSFFLYLVYLFPQVIKNAKLKSTKGLSLAFHLILFVAYITDLIYGFGLNMPWQYKVVTTTGLILLCVQHFQFAQFEPEKNFSLFTFALSILLLILAAVVYLLPVKSTYVVFGYVSQLGWLTYALPQIFKNFSSESSRSLSLTFVVLALLISVCDTLSAWFLNWPLPSKIGAPLSMCIKLVLLVQCLFIRK